jgi:hypothetical protein
LQVFSDATALVCVAKSNATINYNLGMGPAARLADLLRARIEGFERFAKWEASHPANLTPAAAVASIGALYLLLPPSARQRPIDTSGVRRMHDALRHLSR